MKGSRNLTLYKLIELLRDGDQQAFTALYELYSVQLYRKILRITREEVLAREILQEVFLKIWIHRSRLDPEKSFISYLHTTGSNLVFDHFRKVARDQKLADYLTRTSTGEYTHTEEELISKDQLELIRYYIDKLPIQRKRVYMLCKLEGKTYEEVSRELNISTATIHDHIVKANLLLRRYLSRYPELALYSLAICAFTLG